MCGIVFVLLVRDPPSYVYSGLPLFITLSIDEAKTIAKTRKNKWVGRVAEDLLISPTVSHLQNFLVYPISSSYVNSSSFSSTFSSTSTPPPPRRRPPPFVVT